MRRGGRKRKLGNRNVNRRDRRLVHARESPAARAALMPHRRGVSHPEDQVAESELGRMQLRGELEPFQLLAGQQYARAWRSYMAMLGGPKQLLNGRWSGFDCGGCLGQVGNQFLCECYKRERRWLDANRALRQAGWPALIAVQQVVLHDGLCPTERRSALHLGLTTLAAHFGLTKKPNRRSNNRSSHLFPCPPAEHG